jgi:hypothetical protein
MIMQDDRTIEQKESLPWLIVGTDKFMSGWGGAEGSVSYAAWACGDEHLRDCECMVESRKEMKRVRRIYGKYAPKGIGHCHIYVFYQCARKE